jgi:undecaprenyl-diphosphatase
METVHVIVLAIIQGITEFLPISSSGHLILVPHFLHWPDQGLAFDAAIHIGTLAAVVLYFRVQLTSMATAWFGSLGTRQLTPDARYSFLLAVPGTALAAMLECWKMSQVAEAVDWQAVILGIAVAAASGFLCIHFLLRFIQRIGMWPFTAYRLGLAAVIVYVFA